MNVVLVEREPPVGVVFLNRPEALNALNDEVMRALVDALAELDGDDAIRCIVLGGSERAFAAGADIGQMAEASASEMDEARLIDRWDAIRSENRRVPDLRKPILDRRDGAILTADVPVLTDDYAPTDALLLLVQ